jgi:anti-sigma B factor antagonist
MGAMNGLSEINLSEIGGVDAVAVRGELDAATTSTLAARLSEIVDERDGPVIVDLCETSFMDSTGLTVLLGAFRRLKKRERVMVIICPPGAVRRVFELTRTLRMLTICEDRDGARAVVAELGSLESARS